MRVLLDQGLRADVTANLLWLLLDRCDAELTRGAMISVTEDRVRIHYLPV